VAVCFAVAAVFPFFSTVRARAVFRGGKTVEMIYAASFMET
jgi:hypothetical protein